MYWHNTWQPNVCATVGKVRASYSGRVKRCSKKCAACLPGVMLTFHLQLLRRLRMSAAVSPLPPPPFTFSWLGQGKRYFDLTFGTSQPRSAQMGRSAVRCAAIQQPPPQPPISPINTHRPPEPQRSRIENKRAAFEIGTVKCCQYM